MASPAARPIACRLILNETNQGVALQNDATITRYNDTLTVSYVLSDAKGTEVTQWHPDRPVLL